MIGLRDPREEAAQELQRRAEASSAYGAGTDAGIGGADMLDNPYAGPDGNPDGFIAWLAGWTYGARMRRSNAALEEKRQKEA